MCSTECISLRLARLRVKYSWHHVTVFILTFISYALFHTTRKAFSNIKPTLSGEWCPSFHNKSVGELKPDWLWNDRHFQTSVTGSEPFLGLLDSLFMISYAVGLFISGFIGDRYNMRLVLSFGMCSSAIIVFVFGTLTEWLHVYNEAFYIVMWIVNGLLQSTGWPTVVAIMGNWFGKSSRGLIFGIWSANASVGNIIGALLVSSCLHFGYDYSMLVPSFALFCGGIVMFFGLVCSPMEVGLPDPNAEEPDCEQLIKDDYEEMSDEFKDYIDDDSSLAVPSTTEQQQTGCLESLKCFVRAIFLPGVLIYSLAYACLKLVNYALFFWLPFYLSNAFNWSNEVADDISIFYDVGGIIGGILGGFISDRINKRALVITPMLLVSFGALFAYTVSPRDYTSNAVLLAVAGVFIGGPANLISSAISADLGQQKSIKGDDRMLATVTGIIDGTGSAGAAIGQNLVPLIQQNWNWHSVFYFFILMLFLTVVCLLPALVKEIRSLCRRQTPQHDGPFSPRTILS